MLLLVRKIKGGIVKTLLVVKNLFFLEKNYRNKLTYTAVYDYPFVLSDEAEVQEVAV